MIFSRVLLDSTTRFVGPSVGPSVRPSVGPSVRPSFRHTLLFYNIPFLVVSHDSIRGSVRPSVGPSVRGSVGHAFFFMANFGRKHSENTQSDIQPI